MRSFLLGMLSSGSWSTWISVRQITHNDFRLIHIKGGQCRRPRSRETSGKQLWSLAGLEWKLSLGIITRKPLRDSSRQYYPNEGNI